MTDVERQAVGKRLREARESAGLTQTATAKRLGIRRPSVSELESGHRELSTEELYQFAELYAVSADWIATGVESQELTGRVRLVARALQNLKDEDLKQIEQVIRMLRGGGRES